MYRDESLPVQLIKHPFVWSGAGLLIRYGDDPTQKGSFWTTIGLLSLGVGITHTIATKALEPSTPKVQ